jgi:hypothetical protein
MKLFEMKNWKLTVQEQTWALGPFKKLLDKDNTQEKERATKEIAFIWFFCDTRSDYQYITDLEIREKELKKDLRLPSAWKITSDIQDAIDFYNERTQTISSQILKDSYYTANQLSKKMKELVENDDTVLNGATISKLIDGLNKMPTVIKALQETEKAVLKELEQKKQNVGSQKKGIFEDGFETE